MAREGRDEVRIFDQFIDVADEGTAGHMTAGNFVDRNFLFCACQGIQFSHQVCYPCFFKDKFDKTPLQCDCIVERSTANFFPVGKSCRFLGFISLFRHD